jgi:hypothetical protein
MIFKTILKILWTPIQVVFGYKPISKSIAETVDRLGDGCHLVLESAASSIDNLTLGLLSSSATLTRRLDISLTLLANAILGLAAAIVLAPLLHLSQFSSILRFIVWMMYASLCFSMILTYLQQQHFPEGELQSVTIL